VSPLSTSQHPGGVLVISLDFELHWGVFDHLSVDDYRKNLLGARASIPRMLALFEEFEIHATWATVGLLFFGTREDLIAGLPARRPQYVDQRLSAYGLLDSLGPNERDDPFHFARELVLRIRDTPNQEVATHTFSHYYCLEPGQTTEDFRADLIAAQRAARSLGIEITSIVFPRNQYSAPHLDVCAELGIRAFRGNEQSWIYRPTRASAQGRLRRALRLADSYMNLTGHHTPPRVELSDVSSLNIPASRFLRPYSRRLGMLDGLKRRRIMRSMTHAADTGSIFHLWWHPHNTGGEPERNMAELRRLLEHFRELSHELGMRSLTMSELAAESGDAARLTRVAGDR